MKTIEFLKLIWPSNGPHCIAARPYPNRETGELKEWRHWAFDDIGKAAAFAVKLAVTDRKETYQAMHALTGLATITKKDGSTFEAVRRDIPHMRGACCYYADLDCGKDPKTGKSKDYPDQAAGYAALVKFQNETGLPWPLVVNSGGGWHVYWLMDDEVASSTWVGFADTLKALHAHHGLKADPSVTADRSRVLRTIGTLNFKFDDPRAVKVNLDHEHQVVSVTAIHDAIMAAGRVLPAPVPQAFSEKAFDSVVKPSPGAVA